MKLRNEKSIAIIYDAVSISKGLDVVTGSLKQNYYAESATYVPDRFVFPLVLRPRIEIADPNKSIPDGDKVNELARLEWFLDGTKINSNDEFKIEGVTLKVFKNSEEPFVISYRAEWLDPRKKQIIVIEDSLVVSCISLAQNDADATMSLSKPQNWVHNPLKGERVYTINAYVSKGKVYESAVEWYYVNKEGKDVLIDDTCDFYVDGQFTNALNVDSSYMENVVIKAKNISNDKLKEIYWFFDKHGNPVTHKTPEKTEVKGANVFSLPSSPTVAKLDYRIEGLTLEQLVKNGDFSEGVKYWTSSEYRLEVVNNKLLGKIRVSGVTSAFLANYFSKTVREGDKIYFNTKVSFREGEEPSSLIARLVESETGKALTSNNEMNINQRVTHILNVKSNSDKATLSFQIWYREGASIDYEVEVDVTSIYNLTPIFGAGNEPSKEWCDANLPDYVEGTKSVQTPLRVKSVGENLFNPKILTHPDSYITGEGNIGVASDMDIYTFPIKGGEKYRRMSGSGSRVLFLNKEGDVVHFAKTAFEYTMEPPTDASFAMTAGTKGSKHLFLKSRWEGEYYLTEEDYSPYIESIAYFNDEIELRSVGSTKDYIENGRLYKYISDDGQILEQPEIVNLNTSGSLQSYPNGTIFIEPATLVEQQYNDGLQVDLPIKTLESIKVGTEYLDVSKAVVKENLITHPDIENGDFVTIEYIYDDNPIYGDNSISYLSLEEILDDLWLDNVYTYKVTDGKWELVKITEISDYEEWLKTEKTSPYTLAPDGVVFGKYQAETKFIRQYPSSLYVDFIAPTRLKEGVSQIKARALVGTRDGVLENPSKYFTIKWYKRSTGAGQVDLPIGEGNEIIIDVADKDMIGIEIESIKTK